MHHIKIVYLSIFCLVFAFRYRLLCPDGRVEMIDRHDNCNWGFVQPNVIATTSETSSDRRKIIQDFMIVSSYQETSIRFNFLHYFSLYVARRKSGKLCFLA